MAKFEVGDKVRIKSNISTSKKYNGGCCVTEEMFDKIGDIETIKHVSAHMGNGQARYIITNSAYFWTDDMLERVEDTMKYKVGDKVRVREDLVVDKEYGNDCFVIGMKGMLGKTVTIDSVNEGAEVYRIKECGFHWTEEMFEENGDKPSLKGKIVEVAAGYTYYMITETKGLRAVSHATGIRWSTETAFHPIKVWEVNPEKAHALDDLCIAKGELIWEKEAEKVEMTVAEIEKALGYSVKIIKE